MTETLSLEQEFRQAWNAADGESFSARMARRSLEASAQQSPELSTVLFELKNRFQAELDLHLEGASVMDHQTNALGFAELIRGIADAVKEITKQAIGRQRMASGLLISAPVPGSVRVVLRAAAPSEPDGAISASRTETQDSTSLLTVAAVLARAGEHNDDQASVLDGLLSTLPIQARPGLTRAAKAIRTAKWDVAGVLRRANGDVLPLQLDGAGAENLLTALNDKESESSVVQLRGYVDGQRRSLGTMWFTAEATGAVEAVVVDHDLLERVAALAASEEKALAFFNVTTKYPPGARSAAKRSYVLTSIRSAPEPDGTTPELI